MEFSRFQIIKLVTDLLEPGSFLLSLPTGLLAGYVNFMISKVLCDFFANMSYIAHHIDKNNSSAAEIVGADELPEL